MRNKFLTVIILICLATTGAFAQGFGVGTVTPDSSSILDVVSTDKGVLIPRMTTAQRNSIVMPASGLLVYDNDSSAFFFYNGSIWRHIGNSKWAQIGNDIYNTNAGNVGIGTTNPQGLLHLHQSSGDIEMRFSGPTGSTGSIIVQIDELEDKFHIGMDSLIGPTRYDFTIDPQGNVGIGTTNPISALTVNGDVMPTSTLAHSIGSSSNQWNYVHSHIVITDKLTVGVNKADSMEAGVGKIDSLKLPFSRGSILFEGGDYVSENSRLFWDDANLSLGIGMSNPATELDVDGAISVRASTRQEGMVLSSGGSATNSWSRILMKENIDSTQGFSIVYAGSDVAATPMNYPKKVFGISRHSTFGGLTTAAAKEGVIALAIHRDSGKIGINNDNPKSQLHVSGGDIYVENISSGIITKSPDGSCWRIKVDNSGNMTTTSVTCP